MANYSTNELREGCKILLNGDPYTVLKNEYVKPGKGQAFNRLKIRNLKTHRVIDHTIKSGDSLPAADVLDIEVTFLYSDSDTWVFMATDGSFEQYSADAASVGEAHYWLIAEARCVLTLFNGKALCVAPPNFVILAVTDTDPGLRGNTAGGGSKRATLETGVVVRVPLFVQISDLIKVDTRESSYLGVVKTRVL